MTQSHYSVAGAGLAGLSAAIELATRGASSVTVYEQSKTIGGRAATHHQAGYSMNIGPHGFYREGFMRKQFDAWGVLHPGKPPIQTSNAYLLKGGAKCAFPAGVTQLLTSSLFGLKDKAQLAAAFARIVNGPDALAVRGLAMREWIDQAVASCTARQLLGALTRLSTYAADLSILDAAAALRQLQIAFKASVLYIDGGWETLIDGLVRKARSLGVAIQAETTFPYGNGPAILAIPPREVERMTGRTVVKQRTSVHAACLDLGLRRLPEGAATFALGLDQPYYFSVHSHFADGLIPGEGSAMIHVAKYLDTGATAGRAELEGVADLVAPGWRDQVEVARFLPDMTVVHALPATGVGRPDVDALQLPDTMIAGDWVGPEGMLADTAVASGVRAARRLWERSIHG